jgi:nucleoside-diphosphate-sugar epimerase
MDSGIHGVRLGRDARQVGRQVMAVKVIQWRTHPAKKASRSAGSSPTTLCSWPKSSNETTPNRFVHTISARWTNGADFVGPGAQSALGERIVRHVRQGKNVSVLGRADRPHTWSFTDDVARMLVTAGTDPGAWGRAWHVPSNEPRSQRQVIDDFARAAGVGQVRISEIPSIVLRGMGLAWPLMRELRETEYQFRDDFVMDSAAAQASFGLKPAPWDEIVAVTAGSR